ncbi:MAG: TIGR02221 family CRISPR-associated protein [Thermoguttaceae bacterium]
MSPFTNCECAPRLLTARPHILLTALGNRATPTRYELNGRPADAPLAPLALLKLLDADALPGRVIALVTRKAKESTWVPLTEGVQEALGVSAEAVDIPDGCNADEIREILQSVAQRIPAGCYLTLDVTHGYRHFPFVVYALAVYLQSLRDVTIRGAWYGMLEGSAEGPKPLIDLRPLLELPEWFHAVRVFRETGTATPIAERLNNIAEQIRQRAKASGHDHTLHAEARSLKNLSDEMRALSYAYGAGLPLELGMSASRVHTGLTADTPTGVRQSLPLADQLWELIEEAVAPYRFHGQPPKGGLWKKDVKLDEAELERQARLGDRYFERNQLPLALGLMREWIVSWQMQRDQIDSDWLPHKHRQPFEGRLGALANLAKKEAREALGGIEMSDCEKDWASFLSLVQTRRNAFHHHGMDNQAVEVSIQDLESVRERWQRLRDGTSTIPAIGCGKGRLLISAQGNNRGVLFSAIKNTSPDRCLVICSRESQGTVAEAAAMAGFHAAIEKFVFEDPFAGIAEIKNRLLAESGRVLLEADDIVANLTGGTTMMGLAVGRLIDEARKLDRQTRRFALIDKRPPDEQRDNPYVVGEMHWIDEEGAE